MPLLLRAQCCLWLCCWSCCHCPAAAFDYTWPPPMRIEPQAFWRDFVDNDVLSGSFVQYVNCDVKPWDQFREAFQAHFYSGEWKEDGETWFGKATASNLLSMAEAIVQRWQDQDLQPSSAAGSSGGSATSVLSIMQKVYEFLVRISHPPGEISAGSNFPYDLVPQRGMVPFKTIAGFHAVVIVPWSPELCMLRNLFRMRMPLLVPDRSLLRNLVHVANMRIMPFPYFGQHPQLDKRRCCTLCQLPICLSSCTPWRAERFRSACVLPI
eukprot:TRINITY_DN6570_c0_g1_i4.p1 TRINITY_DN6570_c0_g1~~TRINITY_DN6570_c0_g1_i4.p1  ORF type:complete len:267 (+),score=39.96 TRINITY_DN6570_c0_g1_i4:101-901(+)